MKHYQIRKLIRGYKISPTLRLSTLIGIPYNGQQMSVKVEYKGKSMVVDNNTPLMHQERFKDQFGRGDYILYYYEWLPHKSPQIQIRF